MVEHHPGWLLIEKLGIIIPFGAVIIAFLYQWFQESRATIDYVPVPGSYAKRKTASSEW